MMKTQVVLVFIIAFTGWAVASPVKSKISQVSDIDDTNVVSGLLGLIKNVPTLKNMLEKSGFSFDELELLFGEKNLFGDLIRNVYKLSPVSGKIIDAAAQKNVELRVVLALARGQTPGLFDLFKLASSKSENMFNSVDNAASENKYAQLIIQKAKEPHPNITNIWNMITGKNLKANAVLDNERYAVASSTSRKNRHLLELFQLALLNWRPLEKAFRTMSNLPIDYRKVLHYLLGLDYSPLHFALGTGPEMNGKKYMITDNKMKYILSGPGILDPDADSDILNVLHEVRVTYPSMADVFAGPDGNEEARKAVYHLIEEGIEIFNRLLGSDTPPPSTEGSGTAAH